MGTNLAAPAAPERPPEAGFPGGQKFKPRGEGGSQVYFPPNKSLAMVANCMLDVPS
jgi:hypothetical protein